MSRKTSVAEGERERQRGGVVLVVDDVAANRFLYASLLEDDGHEVREAADGREALAEIARTDVSAVEVILLDISMPGMDGLEVLRRLRARHDGGPHVLILTAAAREPAQIERGLSLGADAYLTKPVDNRELAARVRAGLQIHRLRRELAALRRDQTAMLVHDLRHPLANLSMLAELLETDDVDRAERLSAAATIRRMVDSLSQLVDTILTASRLEAGVFTVSPVSVPIQSVIDASAEVFAPLATRRRVTLTIGPVHGLSVHADPSRLRQVLDNLLANALKFTPRGGAITLSVSATVKLVSLSVSDTGPGVSPTERELIFDRYRQGTAGRARGGAGLGLAIARGIIEAHGGTIHCTEVPGGGASFVFTLPRAH